MVVVCAVAGWGLRWSLQEYEARRGDRALNGPAFPGATAPAAELPPPLTVKSLLALSYQNRMVAIAANLPNMTVKEIAPLVEALSATFQEGGSGNGTPESTKLMLRALFTRWAELDGPGMIAALEAPAFQFSQTTRQFAVSAWAELRGLTAVNAVVRQWPGIANITAWEILRRNPEQMETLLPFLHVGLRRYPDADLSLVPLLGIERFVELATALDQQWFVRQALANVAREDGPRALRIAKSLPPGGIRDSTVMSVFGNPGGRGEEPEAAAGSDWNFRAEYETLSPGYARNEFAKRYAFLRAQENPGAALEWVRTLPRGEVRSGALAVVFDALPKEMSQAEITRFKASAWLADRSMPGYVPGGEYQKWLKAEPRAAEAWLATVTDPGLRAALVPAPAAVSARKARAEKPAR
jgi:hypothetical protein